MSASMYCSVSVPTRFLHARERRLELCDLGLACTRRRESGHSGFDQAAGFEDGHVEVVSRLGFQPPREHVGVEHVPVAALADLRARLRP